MEDIDFSTERSSEIEKNRELKFFLIEWEILSNIDCMNSSIIENDEYQKNTYRKNIAHFVIVIFEVADLLVGVRLSSTFFRKKISNNHIFSMW